MCRPKGSGASGRFAWPIAASFLVAAFSAIVLPPEAQAIITSSSSVNVNQFLGAERFYDAGYTGTRTIQANIEAGHIWNGHSTLGHVTTRVTGTGALGSNDSHATRVGAAMGGRPTDEVYPDDLRSWGIAYGADTWSGAIATAFGSDNTFSVTNSSVATTYSPILQTGVSGNTADVFNSSWGFTDPTGVEDLTRGIDGLINTNGTVGVFAAGNEGSAANTVIGPASGYNSISVGALAFGSVGNLYNSVASFSSRGPNDFAMATSPTSTTTIPGVRAEVDIVAPGQVLTLANMNGTTNPHPKNYLVNNAGTSFAAPMVAGGASLIVDAGKDLYAGNSNAIDGRVVKAVLLNSADKITGWNNGQHDVAGVLQTTQSLDWASGAGRMNLDRAFDQYVATAANGMAGTTDLAGLASGDVAPVGWDFGQVNALGSNTYFIDTQLEGGTSLTTTLSWFADRNSGNLANYNNSSEQHLANLDVSVFQFDDLTNRNIIGTVAESVSLYNLVEHLSFLTPVTGYYGIQVDYTNALWNFTGQTNETYGLAWSSTPLTILAGDRFWTNPSGGNFASSSDWNPNQTPGLVDNSVFDLGGSYTIDFSDEYTNNQLRVENGQVTFDLQGHTLALTDPSSSNPSIKVDSPTSGDAQLLISGGTLSGVDAVVGETAGGNGEIVVGAGAIWMNSGDIVVGRQGHGVVDIQAGGQVSAANASIGAEAGSLGTVNVDGIGSAWTMNQIRVGDLGAGELNIQNGGSVVSNSDSTIGFGVGSVGTANVTGNGSIWANSASLSVGGSSTDAGGEGTLVVTNDGSVTVANTLQVWSLGTVIIGFEANLGTLTVDGGVTIDGGVLERNNPGSAFNLASGTTMTIENGGRASFTGDYTTSAGVVYTIGGIGSKLETLSGGALYLNNNAQIDVAAEGLLSVNSNLAVGDGSDGALSLQGIDAAVTVDGAGTVSVGHATTGAATVNIGTVDSGAVFNSGTGATTIHNTGTVAIGSGASTGAFNVNGDLTIDGGVLTCDVGSTFFLADGKTMTIENGGRASFGGDYTTAPSASYVIGGAGTDSLLETLGGPLAIDGGATVSVQSGGSVSSAAYVDIINGELTVDGPTASVASSPGDHSFWGFDGGTANVTFSNGATGTLDSGVMLAPGNGNHALVNVQSDADLFIADLVMGVPGTDSALDSSATLNVDGAGSTVTVGSFLVGDDSANSFAINVGTTDSGATLAVGPTLSMINDSGSVTVGFGANTGTLNATGNLLIEGGLLQVGSGSYVAFDLGHALILTEQGALIGSGTVAGTVFNLSGVVGPGSSIGALTIAGDYTQDATALLSIELAGTSPGSDFDQLVVDGAATLDGTLDVSLSSFMPGLGDMFEILTATGGVTGTFSESMLMLPELDGGLAWQVVYDTNTVALVASLPGDFNGDGFVDAADYTVWRNHLGDASESSISSSGDGLNGVDEADYAVWMQHYGDSYEVEVGEGGLAQLAAAVPEPSMLTLALIAMLVSPWTANRRTARRPRR